MAKYSLEKDGRVKEVEEVTRSIDIEMLKEEIRMARADLEMAKERYHQLRSKLAAIKSATKVKVKVPPALEIINKPVKEVKKVL